MTSVTLQEAQSKLAELIQKLAPGDEIVITDAGRPVAHMKKSSPDRGASRAGCYAKTEFWMSADFDAPLDDF
jgi:antitoxin (DNA-binding transcriptional repressor) of toxin-antitoxin stability system